MQSEYVTLPDKPEFFFVCLTHKLEIGEKPCVSQIRIHDSERLNGDQ